MPLIKRIKNAYLLQNGMLLAYDNERNQIPEFDKLYSIELHKRILLEATDKCEFMGFDTLPNGFIIQANKILEVREKGLSWEEYTQKMIDAAR